jgi:PKD repeat protein
LASSEEWDFGDGGGFLTGQGSSPTHTYATNGSKTVKLRVKDQLCQNFYTSQKTITVSCVLPVNLISFDAGKSGATVVLTWATAMEINNSHFEIQRSTDGIHFTTIGTVKGNGNSSSPINYSFTDENPFHGGNYYRLVQYDFDGQTENSNMLAVTMEGTQILVYPNPSSGDFNIQITGGKNALISVSDALGREVYKSTSTESLHHFSFGSKLPKGLYVLSVNSDNESKIMKIEKE